MPDRDLPGEGTADDTALSFDEGVADITDLLEDPETDLQEKDPEPNATEEESDDFFEAEDVENPDGTEDPDSPDGPDAAVKGGRFAPDSAKVKLSTGETISVGELKDYTEKRVKDMQRDYTEGKQAIAAEKHEVSQYAQQLNQVRDYHAWFAETYLAKPPEPFKGNAATDPVGYAAWRQQQDAYDGVVKAYQAFQQHGQMEQQRAAEAQAKQAKAAIDAEYGKLVEAYPILKDANKQRAFWDQTYGGASEYYGLTKDEVQSIPDHRVIKVLRDAIAYRRLKAKAPAAKDEAARRPAMQQGGKRLDPKGQGARTRQSNLERLRKTGRPDDAVRSLMDFDL